MNLAASSKLPMGWATTTLGQVLVVLRGVTYDKQQTTNVPTDGFVPILRATNVSEVLDFNNMVYVPARFVSREQYLQSGDIVVAASSGSASVVGKAAPLLHEWHGSFGAFCYGLRPSHLIEPKYLSFFLQTSEYRHQVSALAAGVNINNLRRNHIEDMRLTFAPLPEQHRIVAEIERQFSLLDAGVANLRRVQANLKRYRAAVLQAACTGQLVPTEAETAQAEGRAYEPAAVLLTRILAERRARWEAAQWAKMEAQGKLPLNDAWKAKYQEPAAPDTSGLPDLPEGWIWANVDQCAAPEANSITDGPFGSNLKTEHYVDQGPRVIRLQNIGEGVFLNAQAHITEERFQYLKKHNVRANDLVLAGMSERPPRCCIIPSGVEPAIVKADCIRVRLHPNILPIYMQSALNAEPTRKRTLSLVHGVGRPRLNLAEIKSIVVPIPPEAEQERIVAEVERRLSVVDNLEQVVKANLKRAERLRQAVLKEAFAGRLVPQDPNDEPASVLLERIKAEREAQANIAKSQSGVKKQRSQKQTHPAPRSLFDAEPIA